uniref:Uncharacterized LOC108949822 n=1 Tax=Ciona intestinalis TaxID=7719 RepID=H2XY61_CIOIN|nr:uncharacterized protein LOC108949822 [Ciona intestinalis]|eukprot:XP_026692250.1 uncharacterized protein LOC108949822 [Ciona intestinalis]
MYFHYKNDLLWSFYDYVETTERKRCITLHTMYRKMMEKQERLSMEKKSSETKFSPVVSNELLDCMVNLCDVDSVKPHAIEEPIVNTCAHCGMLFNGMTELQIEFHKKRHNPDRPWPVLKFAQMSLPNTKKLSGRKSVLNSYKTKQNNHQKEEDNEKEKNKQVIDETLKQSKFHKTQKFSSSSFRSCYPHYSNPYKRATARKSRPGSF